MVALTNSVWGIPNFDDTDVQAYVNFSFTNVFNVNEASYLDKINSSSIVQTSLKVVHLIASLGGYLKAFSPYVGTVRMIAGAMLLYTCVQTSITALAGETENEKKHFLLKAIPIALGLIARGSLEAFIPFGKILNAGLDVTITVFNHWLLKDPVNSAAAVNANSADASSSVSSMSSSSANSSSRAH